MSVQPKSTRRARRRARSRRGVVMIIVLLAIMMVTLTATFAVYSTTQEIRSSGSDRRAVQAHYLAEAALNGGLAYFDSTGSLGMRLRGARLPTDYAFDGAPEEPALAASSQEQFAHIASGDFLADPSLNHSAALPVVTGTPDDSYGQRQGYQPTYAIDVYDAYQAPGAPSGYESSSTRVSFRAATYTARGLFGMTGDTRQRYLVRSNARAFALTLAD